MPLAPRMLAALLALDARLAGADVDWLLVGGAARALAGSAHRPGDLDVEVAPDDRERAAAAIGAVGAVRRDARVRSWYAAGRIAGVTIELCTDLSVTGPELSLPADWEIQRRWAAPLAVAGRTIAAAPPEELLVRALVGGNLTGLRRRLEPDLPAPRAAYFAARLAAATSSASA
ncbi:MAG TPA: hypothetical protein PKE32_00200 [Miltoncostaeaceae bacterium]|nr:hypothetical protein [Miltoncostaeaceae bacterium]